MSTVIIKRSSEWNAKAREIGIHINDEKIGTVKDGEHLTVAVAEGTHTVKGKMDWCGSKKHECSIAAEETMYFELSGYKYGSLLLPAMLGILILYYIGQYVFDIHLFFLAYVAALLFMYPLYHLTLGRNQYLVLKNTAPQKTL